MKKQLLVCLLVIVAASAKALSLIDSVKIVTSTSITKYGKFEACIASTVLNPLNTPALNPYDSSSVDMYAIFTAPSGKQYRRNAFWMVQYRRCDSCANLVEYTQTDPRYCADGWADVAEIDNPNDPNVYMSTVATAYNWRVRFAPPETGNWSYKVYAKAASNFDSSASYSFTVSSSADKGYLGRSSQHRYFAYKENGEVFIPLGINSVKNSAYDTIHNRVAMSYATELMTLMQPHGGNLLRIMMSPFNFGIEWRSADGPGIYTARQRQAADLDSVLALAEQLNSYVHLVLMHQDELKLWWNKHPYKAYTSSIDSFFINAQCVSRYKQRMRYIIARWGYSPHIFCIEPLQEIDNYGPNFWNWPYDGHVRNWYQQMVQYGKMQDSNTLYAVSTTNAASGKYNGTNGINNIPELDIINDHFYGSDYNLNFQLNHLARFNSLRYPHKAWYFGEMGIKWQGLSWIGSGNYVGSPSNPIYSNASEWHNPLWSTMMSGGAAPGVHWSENVANVLRPQTMISSCWGGQYRYFGPLRRFIENDTIFTQNPLPIANNCKGRGEKDAMWYHASSYAFDTTNNKCACYPREHLYIVDSLIDNNYVSSGITTTNDSLIEVFALKTGTRVLGWIHHKQNYWYRLPHNAGGDNTSAVAAILAHINDLSPDTTNISTLSNDSLTVTGITSGAYRLDFYSTYPQYEVDASNAGPEDGGIIPAFTDTIIADCNGMATFRIPTLRALTASSAPFAPDYGFKLSWLSQVTNTNIAASTTWNSSSDIPGDVTVSNGATLTISGSNTVIRMPKKAKITVKPGAKLVVDGATITTGCDSMWQGIVAEGNALATQSASTQPTIEIKNNATIAHALTAVEAGDRISSNYTGGIVKATSSSFVNNRRGVELNAYLGSANGGYLANQSYFTNCTFSVDSNYRGDLIGNPFEAHLKMWLVNGVLVTGCKFYNTSTSSNRGFGIQSLDAGYKVLPGCSGYWSTNSCIGNLIRPEFEGFRCGILAEGSLHGAFGTVTVDRSDFDKNSVGVRAINTEDIAVLRSTFHVGNGRELEIMDCYQNAGTYTTGVHRFRIEENEYIGHTNLSQPPGWINMGAVTESSGAYDNEIYKNSFTGLTHGAHAWKDNSDKPPISGFALHGLRYFCNTFTDNNIDIAVSAAGNDGIASIQGDHVSGAGTLGTGNTFTDSSYSGLLYNISNTGHSLSFVYAGTKPSGHGWTTNSGVGFMPATQERSCDSKVSGGVTSLTSLEKSSLHDGKTALISGIATLTAGLSALLDEGDTDALMAEMTGLTGLEVHDRLIEIAPYVSETTLRFVIDNALTSEALMSEVLQANPDVLRMPGFFPYLEEQGFDPDDFGESLSAVTGRTEKELEIVAAQRALEETYRLLLGDLKNDFSYEFLLDAPGLLNETVRLDAAYESVNFYFSIDSLNAALTLLSNIPASFNMTSEDEDVYKAQDSVLSIIRQIRNNNQSTLTNSQSETLTSIAANLSGKTVGHSANVLRVALDQHARVLCVLPFSQGKRSGPSAKSKKPSRSVNVYPNPAKGHVVFSFDIPEGAEVRNLTIMDVHGKVVLQSSVRKDALFHWYTGDIPGGIYFYKFYDSHDTYGNGKLIIAK